MRPLEELRPRLHKKATQRKTDRQDELGALLFLILVVPEADEFDVPHMARSRPFEKFELADGLGLQTHSFIFAAVSPCPHRLAVASGKFANGHSLITSPFRFAFSSTREAYELLSELETRCLAVESGLIPHLVD
jgi:hypothetical protein